jgi:hypothetical protein
MKTEEEKIREILKRGMEEPAVGFSERVMLQIAEMQKAPQVQPIERPLKPWIFIFTLLSFITLSFSLMDGNTFSDLQQQAFSSLSVRQMLNGIFSLLAFWVLIWLSPWIKKKMYMSNKL